MTRQTSSFSVLVPIAVAGGLTSLKILDKNPYRLLYSIQNNDLPAVNYIAISADPLVTAGAFGVHEGQHLAAGQPMSDDTDQATVYAVANTAPVWIAIVEISESPPEPEKKGNPRGPHMRPEETIGALRREARTF
jgi:hypothetical protein